MVKPHQATRPPATAAQWAKYSVQVERMDANVARWQQDSRVRVSVIGQSLDGRDINLLRITDGQDHHSQGPVLIV